VATNAVAPRDVVAALPLRLLRCLAPCAMRRQCLSRRRGVAASLWYGCGLLPEVVGVRAACPAILTSCCVVV